jgi:hypothetical protein
MKFLSKIIIAFLAFTFGTATVFATITPAVGITRTKPFTNLESGTDAELKKQDVLTQMKNQIIKEAVDAVNLTLSRKHRYSRHYGWSLQ